MSGCCVYDMKELSVVYVYASVDVGCDCGCVRASVCLLASACVRVGVGGNVCVP